MKVKELIKELEKENGELEVVIDRDVCGWHDIEKVLSTNSEGVELVNLELS